MRPHNTFPKICCSFVSLFISLSIIGCDNPATKSTNQGNNQPIEGYTLSPYNADVDNCLNNIGQDVILKKFSADTFLGNECGVTRFGKGVGLNIYNSFYQQNLTDKAYILHRLKGIASKYGYNEYSILLSDNENKLMTDRNIEIHQVH